MLILNGKHNSARVMIDCIDSETEKQIKTFLDHPAFANTYICIMPDCHAGIGAVIGYTATMNQYVIPNVVGVDIGCGLNAYCLGNIDIDCSALDRFIRKNIPSGFKIRDSISKYFKNPQLEKRIKIVCDNIGINADKVYQALGTLGGGNHFIEIGASGQEKWLIIHSGSRNFGKRVAEYHQARAREYIEKRFGKGFFRQLEYLPLDRGGQAYLEDMKTAQEYARENRATMMKNIILEFFKQDSVDMGKMVTSVHNYINFEDNIIRKGAISAQQGELLLIPLNMRDGVIIGKGKGKRSWNYSAPHGAGRVLSRKKAKELISLEQYRESMQGIWTSCVNRSTLDEAPFAYKPSREIINVIGDTVEISKILKPLYNFKAS